MAHLGSAPAVDSIRRARKTIAFDGTAGNGAVGTVTVFTITGRVFITKLTAWVSETLVGAGTIVCGSPETGSAYIAQVANATSLAADEWWVEGSGTALSTASPAGTLTGGSQTAQLNKVTEENVILTIGTLDVTDGTIIFDVWYEPVSDDGALA